MITTANFVRRSNRDFTIDSICIACFKTVATAERESDLMEKENMHTCRQMELESIRHTDSQRGTF
jgi:hypothetical protein